jgi:hypothetical protein
VIRPKFELSKAAISGMVGNLYRADASIRRELQEVGRQFGEELQLRVEAYTPVDTGFMQAHVHRRMFNDDMAFEVGWIADDFFNEGLSFYPYFVEYGTIHMAAQLPLTRASDEVIPLYQQAVRAAVVRAIARIDARAAA